MLPSFLSILHLCPCAAQGPERPGGSSCSNSCPACSPDRVLMGACHRVCPFDSARRSLSLCCDGKCVLCPRPCEPCSVPHITFTAAGREDCGARSMEEPRELPRTTKAVSPDVGYKPGIPAPEHECKIYGFQCCSHGISLNSPILENLFE